MIRFLDLPVQDENGIWIFDISGALVGVSHDGLWRMAMGKEIIDLDREENFIPITPLVEMPIEDFDKSLSRVSSLFFEQNRAMEDFPLELLIKHVFHTSFTDYWPERAVHWLHKKRELLPRFREELLIFTENKNMSQSARQLARRMLRQLN